MCAFVMKGREGRESVIKGMVIPTVKKGSFATRCRGELGKGRLLGNNVGRMEGEGTEVEVIFMQLARSGDIDRLLPKPPEKCGPPPFRGAPGSFLTIFLPLSATTSKISSHMHLSSLVSDKSLMFR